VERFEPKLDHKDPKKELHFNAEKCECLIPVENVSIPQKVSDAAMRHDLEIKPEFHVTVLAGANGRRVNKMLSESVEGSALREKIRLIFEKKSWDYKPTNEYFLISKFYSKEELGEMGFPDTPEHTKTTIIQKMILNELEEFYKELSKITGLEFIVPYPHITLFTTASYEPWKSKGIGVYSEDELASYLQEKIDIN